MKAQIAFIVLAALLYQSLGASCPSFTAQFLQTTSTRGSSAGTMYMDWTNGRSLLVFNSANYQELSIYNANLGYPVATSAYLTQFQNQYVYKQAIGCDCETTTLNFACPPFFTDKTLYTFGTQNYYPFLSVTSPITTPMGSATSYISNPQQAYQSALVNGQSTYTSYSSFQNMYFTSDGTPAGWVDNQGRQFMFTSVKCGVPAASYFTPPTTCKCGKPIDLVFTVDRTGSISQDEWAQEWAFIKAVVNSFTFGPQACNMGVWDWNKDFWCTISILQGTSFDAVSSAVNAMGCCPGYNPADTTTWCCCCNTPIGGGLWLGAQDLLASPRTTATKVLLLMTDGCQNHMWNATDQTVSACPGCTTEAQCATSLPCINDITTNYNLVKQEIPGVKIIVIGVGTNQTICTTQLQLAAGGILANVFNPTSWTQLQTYVQTIAATACTITDVPCPDCCGICVCGTCIPPSNCSLTDADLANKCIQLAPQTAANPCCSVEDVVCPPQPCSLSKCDSTQGCLYQTLVPAPTDVNNCTYFICNTTTNTVQAVKNTSEICITHPPPPQCTATNDSTCVTINGPNKCVVPSCNANTQTCQFANLVCPPNNKCYTYSCQYATACDNPQVTTCNDLNACTIDTCDNTTGCVFTPITCPAPSDQCFNATCDPATGNCIPYRTNAPCANFNGTNCTVPICSNSTCNGSNICIVPPFQSGTEVVPTTIILATTLATAAVVGIVVAAVIVAAAVTGAAVIAVAGGAGVGMGVVTSNNPIYSGPKSEQSNPLYNPAT